MFGDMAPVRTRMDMMAEFQDLTGVQVAPQVLALIGAQVTRKQKIDAVRKRISESLQGGSFTPEQIEAQTTLWTNAVMKFADQAHLDPLTVLPRIKWVSSSPKPTFTQAMMQGVEWHMGPSSRCPTDTISVVQYCGQTPDRDAAVALFAEKGRRGLVNADTGWTLHMSWSDAKKSVGMRFGYKERVARAIAPVLDEIVDRAVLLESTADVQHRNSNVIGIHLMGSALEVDGRLYRVVMVVKDSPKNGGLTSHDISAVQIYDIENPPVSKTDGGLSVFNL